MTASTVELNSQNYLTDVGAYTYALSPYGTFDQGGNAYEWIETAVTGSTRGARGGSWAIAHCCVSGGLHASDRNERQPDAVEIDRVGFRVATVPFQSTGLPGDYNEDGAVDAADYIVWRKGLGTTYTQPDYDVWRAHFGQSAGSGAGTAIDSPYAVVPEPNALLLSLLGVAGLLMVRRYARNSFSEMRRDFSG